jgi:hypothetical protein
VLRRPSLAHRLEIGLDAIVDRDAQTAEGGKLATWIDRIDRFDELPRIWAVDPQCGSQPRFIGQRPGQSKVSSTRVLQQKPFGQSRGTLGPVRMLGRLELNPSCQPVARRQIDVAPATREGLREGQDLMMRQWDTRLTPGLRCLLTARLAARVPFHERGPERT